MIVTNSLVTAGNLTAELKPLQKGIPTTPLVISNVSSSFRLPKHAQCHAPICSQAPDLQYHPSHRHRQHPGPTDDGLTAYA